MKRNASNEPSDFSRCKRTIQTAGKCDVSTTLESILGETSIESFLKDVYQIRPCIYHVQIDTGTEMNPVLKSLYHSGWEGVAAMLHKSQNNLNSASDDNNMFTPLFFRNQEPLQLDEIKDTYGNSPFAAYLDGCSIINNHADLLVPPLAALCLDLQRSLPHTYVNTYLTPPNAAAVRAHADDRDVFVLQILGEKKWNVYGEVPIPYPFTNEQVGKNDLPVPPSILQSKPLFEVTLKQGDVLYMPRGYVHEATTSSEPSFHATVAIATHDWSMSKAITALVSKELQSLPKFRMAVHPDIGMKDLNSVGSDVQESTNAVIQDAMERITNRINLKNIASHLGEKYKAHNQFSDSKRQALVGLCEKDSTETLHAVGPEAAKAIQLNSKIRAGTPEEKASVPPPISTHGRGLTVREETVDALISIIGTLKKEEKVFEVGKLHKEIIDLNGANLVCDLTLLSFVKCCVELGAMALVATS